ncbi:fibro-slime domain-containing protein [Fibrobacter sp. UBA4297]|uniref:fibro-slime domain-containing protein n=1 Tax=Fibrobacter sp. UBA4297 TaxID=1946536 RepID=UPI0025C3AD06|nr:fibro-slime domain-containing protein [Fibrobacter sp. UBA4297]
MKNRIKSLKLWVLSCAMLIAGVQSASASLTGCEGTVYLKLPEGWKTAYTVAGGQFVAFKKSTSFPDWYETSSTAIGGTNGATEFFISVAENDYGQTGGITKAAIGKQIQFAQGSGFSCADFGKTTNELWIQPSFEDAAKPLVQGEPPDVKYLYVFLPDDKIWKSSIPMINEDGVDREMDFDGENCGWYFRRYVNQALPSKVYIHRDDDTELKYAIGMGGQEAYENGEAPEMIDLAGMFDIYSTEAAFAGSLYFVADKKKAADLPSTMLGWYVERPNIQGNCSYNLAAFIYDTDASLHPSFSCYGGPSDSKPHDPNPDHDACQFVNQTNAASGANKAEALKAIYACIGVTPGIVESTLDKATKKPKLTAAGKKCFIDDKYFNMLFNYTPGVNELTCFDMPFHRSDDGKWEFDSDFYISPGLTVQGGFYPVEATDATKLEEAKPGQTALLAARTKRDAEGPVFYGPQLRELDPVEKIPQIDVLCNGPGWKGGHDCTDLFADGEGTETFYRDLSLANAQACVFGWSCPDKAPAGWAFFVDGTETPAKPNAQGQVQGSPRWSSKEENGGVGRNQHFCFESHANFRFKKGLKFNFRGDDDIWVYIDNKLAVDLGGTHLAAPGYVDLDKFMPNAKPDSTYDIDIFFCDRRTTMSNVRIKTNMFIEQNNDADYEPEGTDVEGATEYVLKYAESGGGSCAAKVNGGAKVLVGDEIPAAGKKITFQFTRNDPTGSLPGSMIISPEEFELEPVQLNGVIDVTHPGRPIVNEKLLRETLTQGKYYLRIKIEGRITDIDWTIKGNVGISARDAVIETPAGQSPVIPFKSSIMGTDKNPTVDQMIRLIVAPVVDPCGGTACTTPLKFTPGLNDEYSLVSSNGKAVFYEMKNGELNQFDPSRTRNVGTDGIDTIYVTVPFAEFDASEVEKVTVNVKQSSLKAELQFFAPKIVFVKSETSLETADVSKDLEHDKMEMVDFYVLALNPDNTPCTDCNFSLSRGSQTSPGIVFVAGADNTINVVNGRATVTLYSTQKYDRETTGTTATLHLTGPAVTLMQAVYPNLIFREPPVPTPMLADIFDVHGALPTSAMNVPTPYFSEQTEYLDGIADSLTIYYARQFHKDSLPEKIAVFWDEDVKDSVLFEKAEVLAGSVCGAAAGIDDTLCLARITLGGKQLSKKVKTGGTGKIKSWATFKSRGAVVTQDYSCNIFDRMAPVIIGARATNENIGGVEYTRLKIEFSEPIAKTTEGIAAGNEVFSFYINNGKTPSFAESLPLSRASSVPDQTPDKTLSVLFDKTGVFPQSGDYIHFRSLADAGLVTDQSDYATFPGADTLRPANDASFKWNVATGYEAAANGRLPSPWALISGEVNVYAARIIPEAMGGIPKTPGEAANLDPFEIIAYDANKTEDDFRKDIRAGQGEFDKYSFIPHGWFVKSDMGALIESKEEFVNANKKNVFFDYDLTFFTNLGSHVAHLKGRVFCDDDKNMEVNKKYYFGGAGHNCVENRRNFFILWNMKSDKNRLVGSGAYITKFKAYVQLDNFGKKNKVEKTEVWGVRHAAKTKGSFPITIKQ